MKKAMKTVNEKRMHHALGKGGGVNNSRERREAKRWRRLFFWASIKAQFDSAADTDCQENAQRHIDRLKARAA